jgi:predicted small metal-binding protein
MKTMTCKQLGGACDQKFQANTFEEIVAQSKNHGMEMIQNGDAAHLQAMQEIQTSLQSPHDMSRWVEEKMKLFEALPE